MGKFLLFISHLYWHWFWVATSTNIKRNEAINIHPIKMSIRPSWFISAAVNRLIDVTVLVFILDVSVSWELFRICFRFVEYGKIVFTVSILKVISGIIWKSLMLKLFPKYHESFHSNHEFTLTLSISCQELWVVLSHELLCHHQSTPRHFGPSFVPGFILPTGFLNESGSKSITLGSFQVLLWHGWCPWARREYIALSWHVRGDHLQFDTGTGLFYLDWRNAYITPCVEVHFSYKSIFRLATSYRSVYRSIEV